MCVCGVDRLKKRPLLGGAQSIIIYDLFLLCFAERQQSLASKKKKKKSGVLDRHGDDVTKVFGDIWHAMLCDMLFYIM